MPPAAGITTYAESWQREKRMVFRARLILECATGANKVQVTKRLGTTEETLTQWRVRFLKVGMGGLADLVRSWRTSNSFLAVVRRDAMRKISRRVNMPQSPYT